MAEVSRVVAVFAIAVSAVANMDLYADKPPFSRYQSIIDRHAFGVPPEGFDPDSLASEAVRAGRPADGEKTLTKAQEDLQKAVSFNAINIESDGTVMVGFTDRSDAKSPRIHYMRAGQSQDGWFVRSADPVAKSIVLVRDSVELSLSLGGEPAAVSQTGGGSAAVPGSAAAPRSALLGDGHSGPVSRLTRRAQRDAREKAEREARERAAAEQRAREREKDKEMLSELLQREREKIAEEQEAKLAQEREEQRRALEELRRAHAGSEPEGGDGEEEEDGED